jgi:putative membrane protein
LGDDVPLQPVDPATPAPGARRYPYVLLALFGVACVVSAIKPWDVKNWLMEMALAAAFVALLVLSRKRLPLSDVSYTLIFIFLCLHAVGAHYSYSRVPAGDALRESFGWTRNHYDRIVHFAFGMLLAYPIRELFLRVANVRGFWGYYLPLDVTMSFSMIYELIEWAAAVAFGGDLGQAYLGTQGDEWDAHKDMAWATLGAVINMLVVAGINWKFDRHFGDEMRESLRVKGKAPLGEVRLRELTQPKS